MPINSDVLMRSLKESHKKGYENVREELDVVELISIALKVCKKDIAIKEAAKILYGKYGKAVTTYADLFANNMSESILANMDNENMNTLAGNGFSERLVEGAKGIGNIVTMFYYKKIDEVEFITKLFASGFSNIGNPILSTIKNNTNIMGVCTPIMAVAALAKAYEILSTSIMATKKAHEKRCVIEKECYKTLKLIKKYRNEMNRVVEVYMSNHIETFQMGFKAMDNAIIDNNIGEYIHGNVAIQSILKYDIQFSDEKEFNNLMVSDNVFKL